MQSRQTARSAARGTPSWERLSRDLRRVSPPSPLVAETFADQSPSGVATFSVTASISAAPRRMRCNNYSDCLSILHSRLQIESREAATEALSHRGGAVSDGRPRPALAGADVEHATAEKLATRSATAPTRSSKSSPSKRYAAAKPLLGSWRRSVQTPIALSASQPHPARRTRDHRVAVGAADACSSGFGYAPGLRPQGPTARRRKVGCAIVSVTYVERECV